MSKIKVSDDELLAMEISFMELSNRFMAEGFSPFACAAIMTKLACMIYKSSLGPEEFNLMMDSISESRDRVKSFQEYQSAGRLN